MLVAERSDLISWRRIAECFWRCNLLLIHASFRSLSCDVSLYGQFQVQVPDEEVPSFFGHCHVTFLGGCTKNSNILFFTFNCPEKTMEQTDGRFIVTNHNEFLEKQFKFPQTHMKKTLQKTNTVFFTTLTKCACHQIVDFTLN